MPEAPIPATGTVTETLRTGVYRATLPNGKPVVVHLARRWTGEPPAVGDQLQLELTPFDFDQARAVQRIHPDHPPA